MKAIILTAGVGARMRPYTFDAHKTLLPIVGGTVLGSILDSLRNNGVHDVLLVTGYRVDDIKAYTDEYARRYAAMQFSFVHNEKYDSTNNIYSLMLAFTAAEVVDESVDEIVDDLLVIESDLIYDDAVIKQILDSRYENAALVDNFRFGMDGTVVAMHNDIITQVFPAHLQHESFDYADKYKTLNIYKFSARFCNDKFKGLLNYYARSIDHNCYYELILGFLVYMQNERIHGVLVRHQWAEIDDPIDLDAAQYQFDRNGRSALLDAGFGGYWRYDVLDFCFIRNMHFPNGALLSTIRRNLPALLHNYGSSQTVLNRKLSYCLLCAPARVIVLNGASQAYPILARLFAGKRALLPQPTFGEYPRWFADADIYADAVGFSAHDINKSIAQYKSEVAIIVNPNNPTGAHIDSDSILQLAAAHPQCMFIIDESFIEFAPTESLLSALDSDNNGAHDNIIVLKSLSKSMGAPGIRLGFVYTCNATLRDAIQREIPIWNLNSLAEFFLESWIKHRTEIRDSITQTIADRESFAEQLAALPYIDVVYPSAANFLLVQLNRGVEADGARIADQLLAAHGIYIKDVSTRIKKSRPCFRFAVRIPADHQRLLDKLTVVVDALGLRA